jgi:ribosomal protein L24E
MKEIKTKNGESFIIDDSTYKQLTENEILKNLSWHIRHDKGVSYVIASINLHRIIVNAKPGEIVDHKNGNGLDNRKSNLRICSKSQNNANRKSKKNGKSKYLGVSVQSYNTLTGKTILYVATIKKDGKRIYIGSFKCEKTAALAYNKKAKELHGVFANLNIIS